MEQAELNNIRRDNVLLSVFFRGYTAILLVGIRSD
jgi:hypothetical protein